jgi:deazaflavin-dependent oxidoreductase (nitroreductase family)
MATSLDPTSPDFDIRVFNRGVIEEYRANAGALSGMLANSDLVLLTTVGARSGRRHTTPLGYAVDGDPRRLVLWASNNGARSHPDWYRNLCAEPRVTVERGTDRFEATASTATNPERSRLFALLVKKMPVLATHEAKAGREIPVVLVELVEPVS